MDQHAVPQPASCSAGEWKAFEDICDRAIGPARLPLVSSLCPSSVGLGMRGFLRPCVELR